MKPKFSGLILLIATIIVATISCTVKDQGVSDSDKFRIKITQITSSTTGTTISWIDDKGDNKNYTLSVYTDAACQDLHQSYNLVFDEKKEKRFSVPYLDTSRKYYICIENALGYKSTPFEVSLSAELIRREVLSQNFDNLFWGYDYINAAAGVKLIESKKPETYIIESLTDAIEDSEPSTNIDDHGGLLSKYKPAMLKLMGFEGWPTTKEARVMPGYIRLGNRNSEGILRTPALSKLEDKTESVEISFNAAIFVGPLQANGGKVKLLVLKGDGSELESKEFSLKGVDGKVSWSTCSVLVDDVTADCYCEIRTTDSAKQVCIDNLNITRHLSIPDGYIYGYTYDAASGKPISNVAVSDGFSVAATDKDGLYMLPKHKDAYYVFYSTPANCEIITSDTGPLFYSTLEHDKTEYNFELKYLPDGKKEDKFALFTFGDIQVSNNTGLNRFKNEAAPAIKAHAKSFDIPCYGITLGDVVSTSDSKSAVPYMSDMKNALRSKYVGMQVFQVMGNHDCSNFHKDETATDANFEIKAQRAFEKMFGPINYSFNRGDIHIIGMRDIVYRDKTTTAKYVKGFLPEQYEWLKQDLALVPKDKMVVLCVHIPLYGSINNSGATGHYVKEVHDLLDQFAEAHIISGHTHIQYNHIHTKYNIYEHNMGTVCGSWWQSNICGDGTPNGYGVYICEGSTFSDWYYMGYAEGMNTREHQMRLYRGNAITGTPKNEKRQYSGYYQFNFGEEILLANVYNADSKWKIEVYEDNIYSGDMTQVKHISVPFNDEGLTGSYTMDDPRRIANGIISSYDLWVTGTHLSLNDTTSSGRGWTECKHLYQYKLKNPDCTNIMVRAIDCFGNEYTETKLTDYRDTHIAFKP